MSLVDKIEELGAAADAGLLHPLAALHQLVEYSDGGLTRMGALDALADWQTIRAQYADIFMSAELGIAARLAAIRRQGGQR